MSVALETRQTSAMKDLLVVANSVTSELFADLDLAAGDRAFLRGEEADRRDVPRCLGADRRQAERLVSDRPEDDYQVR